MLNNVSIMGRIVHDLEVKKTASDISYVNLCVACQRDYAEKNGNRETDFIDVVAWKGTAEFISKFFKKGSSIIVTGKLQARIWEDKEGKKRKTVEIIADNAYFGETKKSLQGDTKEEPKFEEATNNDLPF